MEYVQTRSMSIQVGLIVPAEDANKIKVLDLEPKLKVALDQVELTVAKVDMEALNQMTPTSKIPVSLHTQCRTIMVKRQDTRDQEELVVISRRLQQEPEEVSFG